MSTRDNSIVALHANTASMAGQPDWEYVANLGDCSVIDHDSALLWRDRTGVYSPELEIIETPPDRVEMDDPSARWTIYRFPLDRCTHLNGIVSDNPFHPESEAWFADSLPSVCAWTGCVPARLIGNLCSDDPIRLASAYRAIAEYHGLENFDEYPLTMSRDEVTSRYADIPRN